MNIDLNTIDLATHSNYSNIRVDKTHFQWKLSFAEKRLSGSVCHWVTVLKQTESVDLDCAESITISETEIVFESGVDGVVANFFKGPATKAIGCKLT